MDERIRTWAMVGVSVVVLATAGAIILAVEGVNSWTMIVLLTVVAIAVIALILAMRTMKEKKSGFPLEDERSISLRQKAGNRAFYVSLYLFLFLGGALAILEDRGVDLSNAELMFVLVALMGSMYIIILAYYNHKGRGSPA